MPRLSANLSFLFHEVPFLERFGAAARAGFAPSSSRSRTTCRRTISRRALAQHGLECVLINAPPGDLAAGERGLASLPGREAEFAASIEQALRLRGDARLPAHPRDVGLRAAGCRRRASARARRATLVRNLRHACDMARPRGVDAPRRGAQSARRSALPVLDAGGGARDPRGGRRAEPQGADGFLSHADRRGRHHAEARALAAAHRAHPDRGRARTPRARRRRDQLRMAAAAHRRARLRRLGRLRVPAAQRHRRASDGACGCCAARRT